MEKLAAAIQLESAALNNHNKKRSIVTAAVPGPRQCSDSTVKVLEISDYKTAAVCLAEAFEHDAACIYFLDCPDTEEWTTEQKWTLHLRTFECVVYAHILSGLALGVPSSAEPGGFDAVALWMPPGKNMDDFFTMIRSGFWRLKWRYSAMGRERFFDEFLPLLHVTKEQVMKERDARSWYLVYLGTKAAARGRGLAKKLVRHITKQADAQGLACYLESTNVANLPLYRSLGFDQRTGIKLRDENIALDIMVREPADPQS